MFYWHLEFMNQSYIQKWLEFLRFYEHVDPWTFHGLTETIVLPVCCAITSMEPLHWHTETFIIIVVLNHNIDAGCPWAHRNHCFYYPKSTKTCLKTMDVGRVRDPRNKTFFFNQRSHWSDIAPLICRVARAAQVRGRWAWIPGCGTFGFTPNLKLRILYGGKVR